MRRTDRVRKCLSHAVRFDDWVRSFVRLNTTLDLNQVSCTSILYTLTTKS
jgi:hypothetical protein